ncbi:sensor histidine kinase [Gordonia caeni]|uniref:Histidine kinase/HSP90-like ATPase domain-containing protein n=1 Tax=Gordonia caeni TaxID=1007097 RepID=A0ABP7NL23_9ACTN
MSVRTTPVVAASPRHENLVRISRMFALFTGVGYLGYLLLLAAGILSLSSIMASWWTPTMVAVVFGPGLLLGAVSRHGDGRLMRGVATTAALSFFVAVVTWPFAWNGTRIEQFQAVWFSAFPGLASLAAVVAWPAWLVFVHMVVGCVSVQLINFVARGDVEPMMLLPEILFAIMFCIIFVGGAVMALRTGRLLDETTDETHATAATAAAQEARSVERERFDALIHDRVISTLLSASRRGADDVPAQAVVTLKELDEIRAGVEADRPFDPASAVIHLRATAAEADVGATFEVVVEPGDGPPVPADAVRAVGAAIAEALRNSRRHAGPEARRSVRGVVGSSAVTIEVDDDGAGFEPASVSSRRLGIAVSIRGRMARLPGGSAQIRSAPGSGTTVLLGWERP